MYLFALISLVWLWGGLHMAYRHLWMLIMYVIFNSMLVSTFFSYLTLVPDDIYLWSCETAF